MIEIISVVDCVSYGNIWELNIHHIQVAATKLTKERMQYNKSAKREAQNKENNCMHIQEINIDKIA